MIDESRGTSNSSRSSCCSTINAGLLFAAGVLGSDWLGGSKRLAHLRAFLADNRCASPVGHRMRTAISQGQAMHPAQPGEHRIVLGRYSHRLHDHFVPSGGS